MAKYEELVDVGSLGNPITARAIINANNQRIEDALDNTVSRDGSLPNQMEADFDLNGHYLLNVADASSESDGVNLRQVQQLIADGIVEGDLGIRVDLAQPGGSALVGFVQAGAGAVLRTVQDKLRKVQMSVEDFGAVGDGVTDDYAAIVRTIVAANALGDSVEILFEKENYAFATPLVVTGKALKLVGKGSKFPAYNGAPATAGTTLKYTGSAGQTAIKFTHMSGDHGLVGVGIDCNSLATCGLETADVYLGEYEDISILNLGAAGTALRTTGFTGPTGGGTSWCSFNQIYIEAVGASKTGYHATGVDVSNTCHNQFTNLIINHGDGATGLKLGYSDNNKFDLTFINRVSGVGSGVLVVPGEEPLYPLFPESNYFYHMQAGPGGWVQPANARLNYIFGYDQSNGQPLPVLNGSQLFYTYFGGISMGTQEFVKDINAWTTYTPTVTSNAGTITTLGTRNGMYLLRGKTVYFHVNVTITTNGTGSSFIIVGLPPALTPGGTSGFVYMANGRLFGGTNAALMGSITQGGSTMAVLTATATYPGADGAQLVLSGHYAIN